jgi:glycosyltransferase involved in cell wall biosynthesis
MRIAIATDAWRPQVNGVVRTYECAGAELERLGHEVLFINPDGHLTVPCPSYPSIRLAVWPRRRIANQIREFAPDAIHIATEGPLGHAVRRYCLRQGLPFTTSFHTQFPEYIRMRAPVPIDWSYAYVRRFHAPARATLVPTESQRRRLQARGFRNVVLWSRGVDTMVFKPGRHDALGMTRPIFMYMGRVAVEKNVEAFLALDLPGSKVVVGDGPDLAKLAQRYPAVRFTGFKFGEELARHLAAADVFVFPSLTDTFGIVLLEAMACGVPVAAFPVTGPIDVVRQGVTGVLDADLRRAALAALELDPEDCIEYARAHSWQRCAEALLGYLAPINGPVTGASRIEHATR